MKKWEKPECKDLSIIYTEDSVKYCKKCCVEANVIGDNNGTQKKWQCPVCLTTDPSNFKGNNNHCS